MTTELTDKYTQALATLMPQGYAWPRNPDSVQMRVIRGLAGICAELEANVAEVVRQWQPITTVARLAEWEQATGLPDRCFGPDQTVDQRRAMLLRKLRGPDLAYPDSSTASPGSMARICADLGYSVQVAYNVPARVGRDRVGSRLGALDGRLYIRINLAAASIAARVGQSSVGDRLIYRVGAADALECYLQHILPSRYEPIFTYN